jgi:cell division transport system permease protein
MNVVSRALRGIREHTWLAFVSTSVVCVALVLAGGFALGILNLRTVLGAWQHDAHVSAYLRADTSSGTIDGIRATLEQRPEVAELTFLSEDDARAWAVREMPELAPSIGEFERGTLPASFEIRMKPEYASPEALASFVDAIRTAGPWTDIDYGQEWLQQFASFVEAATLVGTGLGVLIVVAALFLVANTVNLVVYARRDELEIMRLVGATNGYILGPFVVEGALQGLVASGVALLALWGAHVAIGPRLAKVMSAAVGSSPLTFLPGSGVALVVAAGVLVGAIASWMSVRRFLGRLP